MASSRQTKSKKKGSQELVSRRTLVVLSSLVASMTVVSGMLLWLEPTPLAPAGGLTLVALDRSPEAFEAIYDTAPAPSGDRWRAIVIHHSGQPFGNASSLGQLHQSLGYGGLGYHFVVGNGDGADDGEVQVGYRWMRQLPGMHTAGSDAEWYNEHAIGICLIGNGDRSEPSSVQMAQLVRLVTSLQIKLGIPAEQVFLHSNLAPTSSPGRFFPAGRFRQQLWNHSSR